MKITPFFTNIWIFETECEYLEEIQTCFELEKTAPSSKVSNIFGYQSPSFHGSTIDSMFPNLYKKLSTHLKSVVEEINFSLTLRNFWININRENCYNIPHRHPGSTMSAVLYLKSNEKSGNIVFENPTMAHSYPINDLNSMFFGSWEISPKQGRFIIFPSYLSHSVIPNQDDDTRISIAFNFIDKDVNF